MNNNIESTFDLPPSKRLKNESDNGGGGGENFPIIPVQIGNINSVSGSIPPPECGGSIVGEFDDNLVNGLLTELNDIDIDALISNIGPTVPVDIDDSQYSGQWNHFCQLDKTTKNKAVISQLQRYRRDFTNCLEFRSHFAEAIERKCWDYIDVMNHQPDSESMAMASSVVISLQHEVSHSLNNTPNLSFELVGRLRPWESQLQTHYSHQPMDFVQLMLKMLRKEQSILEFARSQPTASVDATLNGGVNAQVSAHPANVGASNPGAVPENNQSPRDRVEAIMTFISELEQKVNTITNRLDRMTTDFQQLQCYTSGRVALLANPQAQQNPNDPAVVGYAKRYAQLVRDKQIIIISYHREHFATKLRSLVDKILSEIQVWKRTEAYAANGRRIDRATDIDQLEDCCKPVGQFLNTCLEHLIKLRYIELSPDDPNQLHRHMNMLQQEYEGIIQEFVKKTLVVETQPPQVLMKDKKFVCKLRHLVGQQNRFETKVFLINTEEANSILKGDDAREIHSSGTIVNNSTKSDFSEQTQQLHVHMRNMSLRMRQRGDRGRADCVAEEKFCMIFRADIPIRFPTNNECTVRAQTMSLPIVVISHGKQEADAKATIFWDNAFSEFNRQQLFDVPDSVRWDDFLSALDGFWKKNCGDGTGSLREGFGLDEDAKRFLTLKLLGRDDRNVIVQRRQINHDNLPGQSFTFWTWLYKILELVMNPYVKKYWNEQLIKGFISKQDCQRILRHCHLGTFLFRFSDSTLGAVSIACYTVSNQSKQREVGHLEPDTIQKFKARSLPDMVKDIKYIYYLYPDRPKDHVFGEYYTKEGKEPPADGFMAYWKKHLETKTDNDLEDFSDVMSPGQPHTPGSVRSHQFPLSPSAAAVFSPHSSVMSPSQDTMDQ